MLRSITLLLVLYTLEGQQNLVCNGDFESYNLTQSGSDSMSRPFTFDYIPNKSGCWQSQGGTFEVKKINSPVVSKVFDFVSTTVKTLCQNFNLTINATYELNYSLRLDEIVEDATVYAKDNASTISSVSGADQTKIYKASNQFVATKIPYTLCFSTTYNLKSSPMILITFQNLRYGPCLDNVTLVMVASPPQINSSSPIHSQSASFNVTTNISTITNTTQGTNSTSILPTPPFKDSIPSDGQTNNSIPNNYTPNIYPPNNYPPNNSSQSQANTYQVTIDIQVRMVIDEKINKTLTDQNGQIKAIYIKAN